MPEAELDLRLRRLLFLANGVYAIATTLLAVELVLPEARPRTSMGASCWTASWRACLGRSPS